MKENRIRIAKEVFQKEILALEKTEQTLGENFDSICNEIEKCTGKVVWIGMGKPGHIAGKLAATMASLGTPAFALHPAEALHGDLGMVSSNDIAVIISYSGESDEIIRLLPTIKLIGCRIIALTGSGMSTLAKNADIVEVFPKFEEACHMGLAPTSSTTVALAYGDALAVVVSEEKKFTKEEFSIFHPAGALGKKLLLKVEDLMISKDESAVVTPDVKLKDAIMSMSKLDLGIVTALEGDRILGIVTDGDIRRLLENEADIYAVNFNAVMTVNPKTICKDKLAVEAYKYLTDFHVNAMPVVNSHGDYVGIITSRMILDAGIVISSVN